MALPAEDITVELSTKFEDSFSEEVWKTTYKDHNDNSVDDTFRRVAKFVASAEETQENKVLWEDRFYDMLSDFKCTAGGRIYSNAGTEWNGTTMLNCFTPDAKVLTIAGYKLICDIEEGDVVLTHKGRWKPVVATMSRKYEGRVLRFTSHLLTYDIVVTPEHPFYQGESRWVEAENLDALVLLKSENATNSYIFDLVDFFQQEITSDLVTGQFLTNRFLKFEEEYEGYVYNLTVQDDESYIVNNVVVHNCFVSPRASYDIDSLTEIIKDVNNQCQTLKAEGGWGQNFSWLRPRGAFIHGIGVETPGSVKYMEIYDKTSDVITSGSGTKSVNIKAKGKIRKGAMMGVLDCTHPDVIEFITAKQQPGRLTKFNISVNCTDQFMNKVLAVTELKKHFEKEVDPALINQLTDYIKLADTWNLRFPDTTHEQYKAEWDGNLKQWEDKGLPTITYQTVSVMWLWNLIMESTYARAEPGILFLDRANYFNPLNYLETIAATNPCGEQTLAPAAVCNLGSINLTQFVLSDRSGFDLERIKKYTRYLNRFLDNINCLTNAPLPEYVDSVRNKRRVGIGILGWGSELFMLKVRFGSERAAELREQVMSTIAREGYMSSIDLAKEKGMFAYCDPKKHVNGAFVQSLDLPQQYLDDLATYGIRNSSLLSIQPTGNSSIFANIVSGGLEPIFMPEYVRTVIVNEMPDHIASVTPKWFEGAWHETKMFKLTKEGDEEILRGIDLDGTVYKIDKNRGLTKEVLCQDYGVRWLVARGEWDPNAEWAVTTVDLSVRDHVDDLKGFTRWLDSASSKTINVPTNYQFEDFKNIYLDAYKSGYVKGVTTYRAGTMTTVLSAKEERNAEPFDEEIILEDVKLPIQSPSVTNIIRADGKKWYLTVLMNEQQNRPVAFFVHTNHYEKGTTTEDAISLLLALARLKGIPEKWIKETERKFSQDTNTTKIARAISLNLRHGVLIKNVVSTLNSVDNAYVGSFVYQIKNFLSHYIKDGEKVENEKCLECGNTNIIYSEGCKKCYSCGSSKCG